MKLIKVTINLAFQDIIGATAEGVRETIIRHAVDGFEAEVAFSSDVMERVVDFPDPDFDDDNANEQIEAWQERASEELTAEVTR